MMIEVNLLPQELRRVEHTPLPRFLVIIVGTTLVSVAAAFGAILNLRRLPDLVRNEGALVAEIGAATQSVKEHDLLVGQIDEVKHRKRAIAEIWRARIIWSKKLEELSEIIPKFIGLDKLTLEVGKRSGRAGKTGGYLNLASVCAGGDVDRLAMFRRILRGDYPAKDSRDPWLGRTWFEDFASIDATPWSREDMPDYEEKEALSFTLKVEIKSDEQRLTEFLANYQKEQAKKAKSPSRKRKARVTQTPEPKAEVTALAADVEPVTGTDVPVADASKEAGK